MCKKTLRKNFVLFCLSLLICFKAAAVKCESVDRQKQDVASQKQNVASQKQDVASQKQDVASQKQDVASQKQEELDLQTKHKKKQKKKHKKKHKKKLLIASAMTLSLGLLSLPFFLKSSKSKSKASNDMNSSSDPQVNDKASQGEDVCPICLENLSLTQFEEDHKCPKCKKHYACKKCMEEFRKHSNQCPLCRENLGGDVGGDNMQEEEMERLIVEAFGGPEEFLARIFFILSQPGNLYRLRTGDSDFFFQELLPQELYDNPQMRNMIQERVNQARFG